LKANHLKNYVDERLKPLRNVSCPILVQNIVDKKVVVDEKEEIFLDTKPRIQKFIDGLDAKIKSN